MNRVAIVGAGITDCRSRWVEATYWDLFQQATRRTLQDAKMTTAEVDSVVYGIYNDIFEHQAIPESALTGVIGMANKPGTRVTSGGATGFYAMRTAIMEVASGVSDCVLCVGGEKATDCYDPQSKTATPMVIDTMAMSDCDFSSAGTSAPITWTCACWAERAVLTRCSARPRRVPTPASSAASLLFRSAFSSDSCLIPPMPP